MVMVKKLENFMKQHAIYMKKLMLKKNKTLLAYITGN